MLIICCLQVIFQTIFQTGINWHTIIFLYKHGIDAGEDDVAPEEGEDDGAG